MATPISNGKTVLVTGINGYIASTLGLYLLEKGYSLRGTSRKASSAAPLLEGPYSPYQDRVTIYEVPIITIDNAFDEAVKGVDGIFHTASPFNFSLNTYEKTVIPAQRGTETLLSAALKAGPQLTAVVVTSSVVAMVNPKDDLEYEFTEKDFASFALQRATKEWENGIETPGGVLYAASKTAADRTVWKFRDEHKPKFSISTINPSVVIGPPVLLVSSSSKLNQTLQPIFDILSGTSLPPNIGTGAFVDVRDVVNMHIWAYEHPSEADGERFTGCGGFGPMQAIADILRKMYKGTAIEKKIPVGNPGNGYVGFNSEAGKVDDVKFPPGNVRVSGKKAAEVMGFNYITFQQSVIDTAKVLEPLL